MRGATGRGSWGRLAAGCAAAALAVALAGCGATTIPPIHSPGERLDVARQLLARRQWTAAAELLKSAIASNPGGAEVDEAVYLLGEAYLGLKDWPAAVVEFERLVRDYPESDSAAAGALRLGDAWYGQARPADFDQENTEKALRQWQSYRRDHPGHWRNAEADRKIAAARRRLASKLIDTGRLYLKLDLHDPARIYFERVETEYGDLDIVADAWLGLARVDAEQGRRERALERLRRIEESFPRSAAAVESARERRALER